MIRMPWLMMSAIKRVRKSRLRAFFFKPRYLFKTHHQQTVQYGGHQNGQAQTENDLFDRHHQPVFPPHKPPEQVSAGQTANHHDQYLKQVFAIDPLSE